MNLNAVDLQDNLQNIFSLFEKFQDLHLTFGVILAIAALFFLALLFATREAMTWFFKINDLKRDVKRLNNATSELEGQIRSVQNTLELFQGQIQHRIQNQIERPPEMNTQAPVSPAQTLVDSGPQQLGRIQRPAVTDEPVKPSKTAFPIVH